MTLDSVTLGSGASPEYSVRYRGYEPFPRDDRGGRGRLFPRQASASWRTGRGNFGLEVSSREVSLGFTPPQGIFTLEEPEGFSSVPI
jgi:hypothetical protein